MIRLALFATHPIQYHIPWFQALDDHPEVDVTVYYDRIPDEKEQGEGFGEAFEWDVPLLEGYQWKVRRSPGGMGRQRQFERVRSAVHPENADVILATGWYDKFLRRATIVASAYQQPLLVRGESSAMKSRPWWVRMVHWGYLSIFDRFLVIGTANQKFYQQYGISARRMFSCPYFVHNTRFDRQYQDLSPRRRDLREAFDIPTDAACMLFAGKFVEKKRPLDFLKALENVRGSRQVHGLMVGSGPLQDDLQAYARRNNVPVTFTGFLNQTEIAEAYTAADTLILPSDYDETWGLVVNEAMVFECPAILSDRVGCGLDLVDDGATGYTFPFGDIEALTDRMKKMATQSHQRQEMGRQARERVLDKHTVKKTVEGTMAAIHSIFKS